MLFSWSPLTNAQVSNPEESRKPSKAIESPPPKIDVRLQRALDRLSISFATHKERKELSMEKSAKVEAARTKIGEEF
ncbi:hypothetical protein CCP3SC1_360004 [Gammaproteobacteria bacterium]